MSVGPDVFPPLATSSIRLGLELVGKFDFPWRFQELVDAPDADNKLYLVDQSGTVATIEDGVVADELFLDLRDREDFLRTSNRDGLRSITFHPEAFAEDTNAAGYGIFYTNHFAPPTSRPDEVTLFNGVSFNRELAFDSVVAEWQFDPETGEVDMSSTRELLRIASANTPHAGGPLRFNPGAEPGDPDYGILYFAVGDLSHANPLALTNPAAKLFRFDPMQQPDGAAFGVPDDNPVFADPNALPGIFLLGLRNPQTLFFDVDGTGELLIGDVSGDRVEEINIAVPGGNYGWPDVEGPLARDIVSGVGPVWEFMPSPLPADDPYQYPLTGYDHEELPVGADAVALGGVVRGGPVPELVGKIIFSNFPDGSLFVADASTIGDAIADGKVTPGEFVQAERLTQLEFEGEPTTLLALLSANGDEPFGGGNRADARFGMDADGNLYVFGKHTGELYRFVSLADAPADFQFQLVDTTSDTVTATLLDGQTFELETPADARGFVAAFGSPVGSLVLELIGATGDVLATNTDSTAPYALFGEGAPGDYLAPPSEIADGDYTLRATAYADANGGGDVLGSEAIAFTLATPEPPSGLLFSLVNTQSDEAVAPLADGAAVDPVTPPEARGFVVDYDGDGTVGSVVVELLDSIGTLLATNTDNTSLYALFGESSPGDFTDPPTAIADGQYVLRATAYAAPNGTGTVVAEETITFALGEGDFIFNLVDTESDVDVVTLTNGATVTPGLSPVQRTISVDLLGVNSEESMVLRLFDGGRNLLLETTDSVLPYPIFGDDPIGDFLSPTFPLWDGEYILEAEAFDADDGAGTLLASEVIRFTIDEATVDEVGTEGDDVLEGTEQPEFFTGLGGANLYEGRGGSDVTRGGPDRDTFFGGTGNDLFDGGEGDDSFTGGPGADVLVMRPGGGADVFRDFEPEDGDRINIAGFRDGDLSPFDITDLGTATLITFNATDSLLLRNFAASELRSEHFIGVPGFQFLLGTAGNDVLDGTEQGEFLLGLGGSNLYEGRGGNDVARGGPGRDAFFAGTGNDLFDGGEGDDSFTGGPGADTLVMRPGGGADVFRDFEPEDGDRINIAGFRDGDLSQFDVTDLDTATLVTFNATDSLLLRNFAASELRSAHFIGVPGFQFPGGDDSIPVAAGLVAAFEADREVTVDLRGARPPVVTSWGDLSTQGNDLKAAGNPRLVAEATPGGRPAIAFDGVGDMLERAVDAGHTLSGLPSGNADRTMFLVVNYLDNNGVASGLVYGDGEANEAFGLTSGWFDEELMVQGWERPNDFDSDVQAVSPGWLVQSVVLEDDAFQHYFNGERIDSGDHTFATDPQRLILGAEINDRGQSELEIAGAYVYDRALSDAEREQVENYLQDKFFGDDGGTLIV